MFAYAGWIRKFTGGRLIAVGISLVILCTHVKSQRVQDQIPVSEIVVRAAQQTKRYSEEFKDLLAKETKTLRIFDKNEIPKKERVIVSNFLVYQFLKGTGEITELRSVIAVDGKPVSNAEGRATDLFERVSKAGSSAEELERIQKESLRFDEEIKIVGLTLFQGIALDQRVRDSFVFEVVGRTMVGDTEATMLRYRQIKDSDLIRVSDRPGSPAVLDYDLDLGELKNASPRLRGTLWIDAKTYQILRENRELAIQPDGSQTPLVIAANDFEYSRSDFGIHTPRRIVHTQFRVDPKARRQTRHIEYQFVYSDFIRPKVDVTSDKPSQS
jgi:hypothetical protein